MEVPPTFEEAIRAAFRGWDALQFAVDQHAGGLKSRQIAEWMIGATEQYFAENEDLEPDEVADVLTDIMEEELHVEVCDGSDKFIGEYLCRVHRLLLKKNYDAVRSEMSKLPSYNPALFTMQSEPDEADVSLSVVNSVVNHGEEASEESDSTEDEETPKKVAEKPQVDDDGWTHVRRGPRKNDK
ncbi:pre-rRNA-processing protein TSR2 homolog [Hyalella azteca]|uniref:Pre-rRNA-processing protein TSR2 homolog n=1 Tax=Hyalella azteca TaxID=294128 RepID=A0A8B7PLR2_HYAAZ|nr:pre-rRNA-processing protein TSR2 homolog [Hyalella azteca]XP_018026336.1 pre-rRNA-processing protein TSR2 homolog [Hyalella azteca]